MMWKLPAFLFAVMISTPALAADNTVVLTPGSGVTMRTQDVGSGVQSPYNILGNVSGTTIYGTAGSSNAAVLSVQGIASGTALPASQSGTWTVGLSAAQTLATVTTVGTVSAVTTLGSITGAVSLPTGASSATNQTTQITAEQAIQAGVGAIGDAAWTSGNGSTISLLKNIATGVGSPVPACSASPCTTVIGAVVPYQGTAVLSATNGSFTNVLQGNAVLSATNGTFANILQGNAVLSATKGIFSNILQGDAVLTATNPVFARSVAGATGGGTLSSAIAPATPAGVNLKASAGTVLKIFATTIQATPVYIKLYNSASAPTCGSGTPVGRFMVPVASTAANGAGNNIDLGDIGAAFGTGIGYCVTGALADNDTTAITATNTLVNIVWN